MRNHNEKRQTNQRRRSTFESRQRKHENAEFKRRLEREVVSYEREA